MSFEAIPGPEEWAPWTPSEAVAELSRLDAPWHVAAGWAIDLWLGRQTREHFDLEIAVPSSAFAQVREALGGYELFPAEDGRIEPVTEHSALGRQYRVLDGSLGKWRLDIFLEPGDEETWVYRRDPRVQAPRAEITARTSWGIPYLLPQAVLLFKAKAVRAKDDQDFDLCAPLLDPAARVWLRDALGTAHPGHAWLGRLQGP